MRVACERGAEAEADRLEAEADALEADALEGDALEAEAEAGANADPPLDCLRSRERENALSGATAGREPALPFAAALEAEADADAKAKAEPDSALALRGGAASGSCAGGPLMGSRQAPVRITKHTSERCDPTPRSLKHTTSTTPTHLSTHTATHAHRQPCCSSCSSA